MTFLRTTLLFAAVLGAAPVHAAREPAPQPAPASMTAEEESLTRLLARKDLIGAIVSHCAQAFPANEKNMQDAFAAWQQRRKSALDQGTMVMLTRSSREDAQATSALVRDEQRKLQAWTADSLGIPQDRKPTAEDCEKIAGGLARLPDPAGQGGTP